MPFLKIFLIGFMGAGKTTLGKDLAKRLKIPFYDLDQIIEKEEGSSISNLFKHIGEPAFRELEGKYLKEFIDIEPYVLATGGGTPCYYDHIQWMNRQGITIYLKLTVGSLTNRLMESKKQERPLIKEFEKEELLQYIEEKLIEREPYYLQSNIILKGENLRTVDIIKEISNFKIA